MLHLSFPQTFGLAITEKTTLRHPNRRLPTLEASKSEILSDARGLYLQPAQVKRRISQVRSRRHAKPPALPLPYNPGQSPSFESLDNVILSAHLKPFPALTGIARNLLFPHRSSFCNDEQAYPIQTSTRIKYTFYLVSNHRPLRNDSTTSFESPPYHNSKYVVYIYAIPC